MKMLINTICLMSLALLTGAANAWENVPTTSTYGNQDNNYQSSSGARYQYDMSNPSDRIDYSVDVDAQRRDQMNVDPSRSLDQGLGQYGGGIYD
jgi:hypothetical protein